MQKLGWSSWGFYLLLCCAVPVWAEAPPAPKTPPPAAATTAKNSADAEPVDMQNEDTFIDVSDALRSKQYVHRAILNSLVHETNRFAVGHFYLTHMMGFNNIWQKGDQEYSKFSSGLQGLSLGYVSPWGHGVEVGGELSAVSNVFVSYKYFLRPKNFALWGVFGGGIGTQVGTQFADGPPESRNYNGQKNMAFFTVGLLVPTIDVGFKVEGRVNFYGGDRTVLTTGLGLILFL